MIERKRMNSDGYLSFSFDFHYNGCWMNKAKKK